MTNSAEAEARNLGVPGYMIVGGRRIDATDGPTIEVIDPGSGVVFNRVPAATAENVAEAVDSAKTALRGPWRTMAAGDRGRLLMSVGDLILADSDRLARVETLDTGKPLRDAAVSVRRAADYFTYYGSMVDKHLGATTPLSWNKLSYSELVPIGITAHIVPWNVPVSMVARSLAPALACGNTAVVKPAEDTPMTALLLAELVEKAGAPPGVVNIITGLGSVAGQALAEHPDVAHITFTGSVETGKRVMAAAASHVASVTLELGGKSPHVVLADADLEVAARDVARNAFRNAGQICSAGTRLIVDLMARDELIDRVVTSAKNTTVGYGLDNPDIGPLISAAQLERVSGFVDRARGRGLNVVAGGNRDNVEGYEGGYFYRPTVVADVPVEDEIAQLEVFGPVLTSTEFEDIDEAIAIANSTNYGLAAGIHTTNISSAMRFAREVEAGQVFINGYHSAGDTVPFGGMKQSGIGREKGLAALANYCQTKSVTTTF